MTGRTVAGAVLTGGASTRMGADKALLPVDGRPMAVRVAATLRKAGCHPVWCQGGNAEELSRLGLDVVPDTEPDQGPVVAILTALDHADGAAVVIAACDLVDLDAVTVARIAAVGAAGSADVVVARSQERIHLLSWWSASAGGPLAASVGRGIRSYREAVTSLVRLEIEVPGASVVNVNRPDDLDRRPL